MANLEAASRKSAAAADFKSAAAADLQSATADRRIAYSEPEMQKSAVPTVASPSSTVQVCVEVFGVCSQLFCSCLL
jgi:hypothetical protein